MDYQGYAKAHIKALKVISSCENREQIITTDKYLRLLDRLRPKGSGKAFMMLIHSLDNKAEEILF